MHKVVHNDIPTLRVYDALTLPATGPLVITDLAVAVDGSGFCSGGRAANYLLEQRHNFPAVAGRQARGYKHRSKKWTADKEESDEQGRNCKPRPTKLPAP